MNKKSLVWSLAIFMLFTALTAQDLPGRSAFSLVRSGDEGIQIRFELPQWELESVKRDGQSLQRVKVADVQYDFIGEEETLPVFAIMVAIPYSGGVNLSSEPTFSTRRQSLRPDFISALNADREAGKYGARLYPENAVQISEPQVLRDFRVVALNVRPFQYDSHSGELLVTESLDIRLDFNSSPSVNETAPPQSLSPAFEKIYKGFILNYSEAAGRALAQVPGVTLCYHRRTQPGVWDWPLFCMIHARSRPEALAVLDRARALPELAGVPHKILFSTRCFKQRGALIEAA